jgi:hypothetical protein
MPKTDVILSKCRAEILRLFASYVNLTGSHIQHLTGRPAKTIERDLRWLRENGYLVCKDHPLEKFGPLVWRLAQQGWDWCLDEKLFDKRVNATDDKGDGNLPHDLVLTDLHIKFHDLYGDDLYWTQLYQHCYRRFDSGVNDRVNMDAFTSFPVGNEHVVFCVEAEKSRDSKKFGKSARGSKAEAYDNYAKGHFQKEYGPGSDFRVLWTFSTAVKAANFAGKLHDEGGSRRHWILDENLISTLTRDSQAFLTPKDVEYQQARHRWNAQRLYSLDEA